MAGRKPSRAPVSSTPLPSALAIRTRLARTACSKSGDTEGRVRSQFERIAEIIVQPAVDGMHAAQAAQGLEEHGVVAHREVPPLDQRKAQVARQESVFERFR